MGPKRNQVSYIKPNEPAFLRRIKEQAGYKEGPTVDTKREIPQFDDDSSDDQFEDKEDEMPTVVVLKPGDLTAEQASTEEKLRKEKEDKELIEQGKITFKAQKKRASEDTNKDVNPKSSNNKKPKQDPSSATNGKVKQKKSLLSFEEEDDGED